MFCGRLLCFEMIFAIGHTAITDFDIILTFFCYVFSISHMPEFRREKLILDQATFLTQNTKDSFTPKQETGAVFVELTTAYDTVWPRNFTC